MRFFLVALCVSGALTLGALRLVGLRHRSVALGYDIAEATRQQRALEEELRQLRIDRAALLEPRNLETLAVQEGLRTPLPDEVVVVGSAGRTGARSPAAGAPALGGHRGP